MKLDVYGSFIDVLENDVVVAQIRLDDSIQDIANEIKILLTHCGKEIEE